MPTYNPTALERGLKTTFLQALAQEPDNLVSLLAMLVPSDGSDEKHVWIGEPPQMEELRDTVKFTPMSDTGYTITNKTFSSGIEVRRNDLADDRTGAIHLRVRQLAQVAKAHPNKLIADALVNSAAETGYDGAALFANSHAARGAQTAAQDNLLAGTGVTTAALRTDIASAIAAMRGFVAENNEPVNENMRRIAIVAPPALEANLNEALFAQLVSNTSNVMFRQFEIIPVISARLSDANDWYMLDLTGPTRALIFQDREPLEFVAQDTVDSDATFSREVYRYKARARYAVGFGLWQKAVKMVNA